LPRRSPTKAGQHFSISAFQLFPDGCFSLSPADLKRVRDWLNDFVEDRLEFREDFEGAIRKSEQEMAAGLRPRVRKPEGSR
jgi:hypothetical protein